MVEFASKTTTLVYELVSPVIEWSESCNWSEPKVRHLLCRPQCHIDSRKVLTIGLGKMGQRIKEVGVRRVLNTRASRKREARGDGDRADMKTSV